MKIFQKIILLLCTLAVTGNILAQTPSFYAVTSDGKYAYCGTTSVTLKAKNAADGTPATTVLRWDEGTIGSNGAFTVTNSYYTGGDVTLTLAEGTTKSYQAVVSVSGTFITSSPITLTSYVPPVAGTLTGSTAYLNSGAGTLTYTGGSGTVQWMKGTLTEDGFGVQWVNTDPLVNGAYTVTETTWFKVRRSSPACPDLTTYYTDIASVQVYKTGTIVGPSSVSEGTRITMTLTDGYYESVVRWEFSTDEGNTWSNIEFPYSALRYEVVANTKFRALVDLGPFGSVYSNVFDVAYSPYTQNFHPLVGGNNYVREQAVTVENIKDPAAVAGLSADQKQEAVTYLDGHGRTVQQNVRSASPLYKDIVAFTDYDHLGRQVVRYRPYVSATQDGSYQSDPFGDQLAFYGNPTEDKVANTAHPFAASIYESSPLGRVTEQGSVGDQWQPGGGHTKQMFYSNNVLGDVRQFNSDGSSSGFYATNMLSMVQATDEDGKKKQVFTDLQGRTVLTRTELGETVDGTLVPWLETYYIYSVRGAVSYIVSPKGVAALKGNGWQLTDDVKNQYVHQFIYDARGRAVEKKVPGQAWMYYCYDRFDRLVLAQDGKLHTQNNWLFIKYDKKGRVVRQGLYTDNTNQTRAAMQSVIDPLYASDTDVYFESDYSTNYCFPTSGTVDHVINRYDSYVQAYTAQGLPGEAALGTPTGLLTGSSRLVLGTNAWLDSHYFYDADGRLVQELSNNHLSQTLDNLKTYVYDFTGKVKLAKVYHHTPSNATTVINKYYYDHAGRLVQVYQNNNNAGDVLVAHYNYNELGQLVEKNLHCASCVPNTNVTGSQFVQSVDYRYDARGSLASINNAQLNVNGANNDDANDLFGMELLYQDGLTSLGTGLYNGNVSAVKWKGAGAEEAGSKGQRSYQYSYDNANRLRTSASQVNDGTAWTKETGALNENTAYDLNGNIRSLQRNTRAYTLTVSNGKPSAGYAQGLIDDLTYTYNSTQGDQLLKVTDAAGSAAGFDNGASTTGNDYTYDTDGNLTADQNKGIAGIAYNHLGKPTQVSFTDGRTVSYVYDATGNKLSMTAVPAGSGSPTTTDYVGGFVYTNNALSFFSSPEGRVVNNNGSLEYQYAIADHQGNTRVVFTSAAPVADTKTATFDDANEADGFENYGHTSAINNHTPGGANSQYLNGGYAGVLGVAKSYKVYPGDKLKIEAYGSYNQPTSNSSSVGNFASLLLGAFHLTTPAAGETGTAAAGLNAWGSMAAGGYGDGSDDDADPKAFVNIVLFDKDYNFLDVAYAQLKGTSLYYMSASYTVKEAGYAIMYVSNENATQTDVYFDDVTMTYTPTRIVQYNEYYPYGMQTASSWTRDNTTANNFLYNSGTELNSTTGMYETAFRGYDPALGRFMQVDPLATKYASLSGYHYSYNNPVMFNDPSGADPPCTGCPDNSTPITGPQGGGMPMWYSYGPPAWTGDMSAEELLAYTAPGGMPDIAYATMYWSLENKAIMDGVRQSMGRTIYNRERDGALEGVQFENGGIWFFYDKTATARRIRGTGDNESSFGVGQRMDDVDFSVDKPLYYSYGNGLNSAGPGEPNWAMKFLIGMVQPVVEWGSVLTAAAGNAYTIIKNEGFVDSPSIKNQPFHPVHMDDNGNITDRFFYPSSGGVPIDRGVELLNATSNTVIGAAVGGLSVEVNYFNNPLINQGLGSIMTQGVQTAVSAPLQAGVEYGTSQMK